jgi:hypothetical protein
LSTRSFIGRKTEDGSAIGVFHHWDGYPDGVGATLWGIYHGTELGSEQLKGNLPAMLDVLLSHTWSSINSKNWAHAPGYCGRGSDASKCVRCHKGEYDTIHFGTNQHGHTYEGPVGHDRPECYCHGDEPEEFRPLALKNAARIGAEYAYVFDAAKNEMAVLSSYIPDDADPKLAGQKMVGFFGVGYADSEWRPLAVVSLDGDEPDWRNLERDDDDE